MTIDGRAEGWLDALHHARLREALLQTLVRYDLLCPVYCLMPDHGHFVWMGITAQSDQLRASAFFRRAWNALLRPGFLLQKQGHDHVCRENERNRDTFRRVCQYVLENPTRAGLVESVEHWDFLGALAPGYPRLDPRDPLFWDRFWRIFELKTGEERRKAQPLPRL